MRDRFTLQVYLCIERLFNMPKKRTPEQNREYVKQWKLKNKDKVKKQKQRYRAKNRVKNIKQVTSWKKKHPDKVQEQKRRYREKKKKEKIIAAYATTPLKNFVVVL